MTEKYNHKSLNLKPNQAFKPLLKGALKWILVVNPKDLKCC